MPKKYVYPQISLLFANNTQNDLKRRDETSSGQNGFSFRGAKACNGLSAAAKMALSVKSLDVAIEIFLFHFYFVAFLCFGISIINKHLHLNSYKSSFVELVCSWTGPCKPALLNRTPF